VKVSGRRPAPKKELSYDRRQRIADLLDQEIALGFCRLWKTIERYGPLEERLGPLGDFHERGEGLCAGRRHAAERRGDYVWWRMEICSIALPEPRFHVHLLWRE